jgi:hypothetical protein
MTVTRFAVLACCAGLLMLASRAQAQGAATTINLVDQDRFVQRSLQIVMKSAGAVASIKTIRSIDAATGTLRADDVFGKTQEIPITNIDRIDFTQRPQRQAPMAQEPPWTTEVFTGAPFKNARQQDWYSAASLQITNGVLTIADLPPPVVPPSTVPASQSRADQQTTWEVRTIRYDAASKSFQVVLLPTRYEKRYMMTGGGSSGSVKGLP